MKKLALTIGYFGLVAGLIFLNSCQDDPINPNDGNGNGGGIDTTWVNDSTDYNNGGGIDSTDYNGGGDTDGGNGDLDSTYWGNDSTYWGNDSLGG